jgi:hypothetical protein
MRELKAGESIDFIVGGKTLTIEPLPFGNIKKILKTITSLADEKSLNNIAFATNFMDKYLVQIFPQLFIKGKYPFLTDEWIEDSLTIPDLRKIVEAACVVNGLQDFLEKMTGKKTTTELPSSSGKSTETPTTPSEKDGSITSSDLATAGGPKT